MIDELSAQFEERPGVRKVVSASDTVKAIQEQADRIGVTASFADIDNDGDPDLFVTTVRNGNVLLAHSYRLGSLRLREMLETYQAPTAKLRAIMENQIDRTIQQIVEQAGPNGNIEMVALGTKSSRKSAMRPILWAVLPK